MNNFMVDHHCLLRDPLSSNQRNSSTYQSYSSIDHDDVLADRSITLDPSQANIKPLLTKEIYSASNAIKFICAQLQNKEDYEDVSSLVLTPRKIAI